MRKEDLRTAGNNWGEEVSHEMRVWEIADAWKLFFCKAQRASMRFAALILLRSRPDRPCNGTMVFMLRFEMLSCIPLRGLLQLKACALPWSGCINVRCSVLQLHAWSYAVLQLGLANSIGVAAAMLLTVAAEKVVVLCCFAVRCLRKALGWLLSVAQCCSCAVVVCSLQLSACKSHRNGCNKDVHWSHGLCNPVVSFSLFGIFFLSSGSLHIPLCCHHSFSASICLELPSSSSLLLDIISFYWQDHQLQRPLVKLGTFFLPSKSWIFELWTSLNLQPRFELFACILISYDTLQLHVLSGVSSCILMYPPGLGPWYHLRKWKTTTSYKHSV